MTPQCNNCGKFISTKVKGTAEFDVSDDFRKIRHDVPAKVYLCPSCAQDPEFGVERYIETPWYAGHRFIG